MKKIMITMLAVISISLMAKELPSSVTAEIGKVKLQLEKKVFWNITELYYSNELIGKSTGYWGTVTRPKEGWIGTGHKENGIGETNLKVEFLVDGKVWKANKKIVKCNSFEIKKSSTLLNVELIYNLKVENNTLFESVSIKPKKDVSMRLYNFMRPFTKTFSEYYTLGTNGKTQQGTIAKWEGKNKNMSFFNPKYYIIYSPSLKLAVVSELEAIKPFKDKDRFFIVDRKNDNKFYYVVTFNNVFTKDIQYSWNLKTSFVETDNKDLSLLAK